MTLGMSQTTRAWLHGLIAAFIGSSASSLGTILVAPDRFNLTSMSGFRNLVLSSGISGVVAAAAYLKASPLPPLDQKIEETAKKEVAVTGDTVTATESVTKTTTTQAASE